METGVDANGGRAAIHLTQAPTRVVSLVPSVTESLFDLGLADRLVGITDYCVHPAAGVARLPRIGGTKNPDLDRIVALRPDLVIANQEENREQDVLGLEAAGVRVWVTFPRTVAEAIEVLWAMIRVFNVPREAFKIKTLEQTLEWAARSAIGRSPIRVFVPIWRDVHHDPPAWWMTVNRQTYVHSLLEACGAENVFAYRARRYPLAADLGREDLAVDESDEGKDTRYPRVAAEEIIRAGPQMILLPSEPYEFGEDDVALVRAVFAETPAVQSGKIHRVDGSLLTWHGTRLARALAELPGLFEGGGKG